MQGEPWHESERSNPQARNADERHVPTILSARARSHRLPHPLRPREHITEEDRRAIAEADAWSEHHTPIALEHVLADFGLTMTDWETMAKSPLAEDNSKPNG